MIDENGATNKRKAATAMYEYSSRVPGGSGPVNTVVYLV
jgi:hypothetical protein